MTLTKIRDCPARRPSNRRDRRALNELSTPKSPIFRNGSANFGPSAASCVERFKGGSLDLDMPRRDFRRRRGLRRRIERIENDESHQLIEEFMLLANESGRPTPRKHNLPSLYRVHDDPDEAKLNDYRQLLATNGIKVATFRVARVVSPTRSAPRSSAGLLLRTQLLRSMRKACSAQTRRSLWTGEKRLYRTHVSIRRYSRSRGPSRVELLLVKFELTTATGVTAGGL